MLGDGRGLAAWEMGISTRRVSAMLTMMEPENTGPITT